MLETAGHRVRLGSELRDGMTDAGGPSPCTHIERPTAEGSNAWVVVQLFELFRRCDEIIDEALRIPFGGSSRPVAKLTKSGVDQSADDMRKIVDAGLELMEMAERLGALTDGLPTAAITVGYEDVARAAAYDISQGIIDLARLRWASALVDWRLGWAALAESLRQDGVDVSWAGVNLHVVLGVFRNTTQARIRAVARSAGLDVKTCPADCTPAQLDRLVRTLLEAVKAQSA
jgi:hypothetical protein